MYKLIAIVFLGFVLSACSENNTYNNLKSASWSEVIKTCGNSPTVDSVVLACLNIDWIKNKEYLGFLNTLLSDCINESFSSQPSLNYSFVLTDLNNFDFEYNSGSCTNQYQRYLF